MFCVWEIRPYGQKLLVEKEKKGENSRNTARVGKRK